jgi:hypothetical protein
VTFLSAHSINRLLKKSEYPKFAEKPVVYYDAEQVKALYAAAKDNEDRFTLDYFFKSGVDRAAAHAEYGDVMTTSSSLMSVPDDYLKLVPALRPYFHEVTGVVWAASWRRDVRKGIFHDSLSLIYAVGTEKVSLQKPVSFVLWPVARSDCLGNLLRAVQPPAQFLGSVPADNSDLIFTTVVVRHVFSP